MERFGLVGLPNAGKSSLLNALSGAGGVAAPYPFATTDTNVGVARVPDRRLDEVDAIVMVLRAFEDADVPGSADPVEQLAVLETELALADLQRVEEHIDKQRKAARADRSLAADVDALDRALAVLAEGTPLHRSSLDHDLRSRLKPWFLLTDKPLLTVVNLGEGQVGDTDAVVKPVADAFGGHADVLPVCVQLEAEAAELEERERLDLLDALGLGEGALPRLVGAAYAALDLRTFFTANTNEARAWTARRGATAKECAGRVHTDFERGFIKAEVVHWDDLVELGSWHATREAGRLRIEGREYEVQDGDVVEIRFNV